MNIIISGSEGFLGRYVKTNLRTNGDSFNVVKEIDVTSGDDLCSNEIVEKLPSFDCFIHLANLVYVPGSYVDPEKYYRVNYLTTLNALEACRKNKAHLIYLSSYIYGHPQYLPVSELHPIAPFNPYAQTKYICESLCEGYHRDFGVNVTILRPFNIYGSGQKGSLLIPEILKQLKEGNYEVHLKAASPRRDFVHVVDVAKAIVAAIDDKNGLNVYNVCSGSSLSVKEITEIINRHLKKKVIFSFAESDRPNEVDDTIGSYEKLSKKLGWKPSISFEEGMAEILKRENL